MPLPKTSPGVVHVTKVLSIKDLINVQICFPFWHTEQPDQLPSKWANTTILKMCHSLFQARSFRTYSYLVYFSLLQFFWTRIHRPLHWDDWTEKMHLHTWFFFNACSFMLHVILHGLGNPPNISPQLSLFIAADKIPPQKMNLYANNIQKSPDCCGSDWTVGCRNTSSLG